jgi:MFS family permease
MALAFMELVGTVGSLAGGSISDRIGRKKVLYAGMILGPAALFAFVQAQGWLMVPCLVCIGIFVFACSPVLLATVQDHAGENRGAANVIVQRTPSTQHILLCAKNKKACPRLYGAGFRTSSLEDVTTCISAMFPG